MTKSITTSSGLLPRAPRHARVSHYKQHIDWLSLFLQVDTHPRHCCAAISSQYRNVSVRALQRRYKQWKEAQLAHDDHQLAIAEGRIDGRRYSRSALGIDGDHLLAEMVKQKKAENTIVNRDAIINEAFNLFNSIHPRPSRTVSFHASPQFITGFRRRHHFSTTIHKIHNQKKLTEDQENDRIDITAEYLMKIDAAIDKYGAHFTLNADETGAKAVQHPSSS
jgi:hypothetical protein